MKEFTIVLTEIDLKNIDQWLLRTQMTGQEARSYCNLIDRINIQLEQQNNHKKEVDKHG